MILPVAAICLLRRSADEGGDRRSQNDFYPCPSVQSAVAILLAKLVCIRANSWLAFIRIRNASSLEISINEGHKPLGALHVVGVAAAERLRKRLFLHIHPVNESRANR
jgi:hypothetical protein